MTHGVVGGLENLCWFALLAVRVVCLIVCFNVPFLVVRDSLIAGKSGRSCQNDDHGSSSGVSNHPDVSASCAGLSGRLAFQRLSAARFYSRASLIK